MIHLKKKAKPLSICGEPGEISKFVSEIDCPNCIERVISIRIKEISFLSKASSLKKPIISFTTKAERSALIVRN